MGLWHPERASGQGRRLRRPAAAAGFVVLLLALSGCSQDNQWSRFGMPDIKTEQGESILSLWQGAWIAALVTGVVVWALMLWAVVAFRRRSDDEIPVQTRYNLPIEIFYTIFPIVMVVVFFAHTVRVQNEALEIDENPDVIVDVVGQKWQWTFNYPNSVKTEEGTNVFISGVLGDRPTLVIPVDQTVEFRLTSPDVIHDFGIPAFAMRMDVVPGEDNKFQVKPNGTGTFKGYCYELCGTHHSRMLFYVKVVSAEEYEAFIDELASDPENVTEEPILGGKYAEELIDTDGETEGDHE